MKILRMTVGNYKNIGLTTLDCSRMIALISTNNYGKSNLLEAIQFGLNFISDAARGRKSKMCWRRAIPLNTALAGEDYTFSIEFDEPDLGEYRFVKYGFTFAWYNDMGSGARIINETMECRAELDQGYTSYLLRSEGKFRASKIDFSFRGLDLSDDALAIDAIELIRDVEIAEAARTIKKINYRMCESLDLNDSYRSIPIEFSPDDDSHFENEDIPGLLAGLQEKREDLYQLFEETVYDLFPEFMHIDLEKLTAEESRPRGQLREAAFSSPTVYQSDIKIPYRIRNEVFRLMIDSRNMNQPMSMEQMSMGTKRVFWLIANAVMANDNELSLLGIDEIETSIHPRMIKGLLEAMTEILENSTLMVTSHSPYLIQYLKPESIYIGVPNLDGTAVFRKIRIQKVNELLDIARRRDMTLGEYLFELMSGDEDSAYILSSYLED